jgi:hypothetical protein
MVTFELFGSSVKTASDPVTGMPAIAVAATVAVTLIVPSVLGATVRDVELRVNPAPTSEAETCSGEPPLLVMVSAIVVGIDPQPTAPKLTLDSEKVATGGAPESLTVASEACASPPSAEWLGPSATPSRVASLAWASPPSLETVTELSSPAPRQPTSSPLQANAAHRPSDASLPGP